MSENKKEAVEKANMILFSTRGASESLLFLVAPIADALQAERAVADELRLRLNIVEEQQKISFNRADACQVRAEKAEAEVADLKLQLESSKKVMDCCCGDRSEVANLRTNLELCRKALETIASDLTLDTEARELAEKMIPNVLKDIDGIRDFAKAALDYLEGKFDELYMNKIVSSDVHTALTNVRHQLFGRTA